MVFKKSHDGNDAGRRDIDGELIFPDGKLLDVFWKARQQVLSVFVQAGGFFFVSVGGVNDGSMKLASRYDSRLAVNGVLFKVSGHTGSGRMS